MSRILTGIQSSGIPHLGNLLGAIIPAIELSKKSNNESYFFIADLHSLTSLKDAEQRKLNTRAVAAAWLAFGFDIEKNCFYKQSDLPEVCEFTWLLSCFTPYPMLANAHSFKDKSEKLSDVNAGLFIYPVLMAADILMYDAQFVPVGKDQLQHLEITRDIATAINHYYGKELLILPEPIIQENVKLVPGTDGKKMSKSYGNTINIFQNDKALKKNILNIITDSTPLEEPKNPDTCVVFKLFSLLADESETENLRKKYLGGGFGYGHAKNELYTLIIEKYKEERIKFNEFMADPQEIDNQLKIGANKARVTANAVLERLKSAVGF
jgi:tryptophanyl-tRNA synthetase